MINQQLVKNALDGGVPAIKDLFNNLPKEDILKGIGLLVILGAGTTIINAVKEIVLSK